MGARIAVPRFVGGTNMLVSRQMADERTINFFPETTGGGGKVPQGLRPTEGIQPFAVVDIFGDTSALFSQDGRAFFCCGFAFGEIFEDGTTITRGTINYDADSRATMCSNGSAGHQICIVSGGILYIYNLDTNVFTQVGDFQSNNVVVRMCEFMDGYFFALEENSRRVYYSALEDGLTWDFTFGYIERSWGSDNISFIKRAGRQLWLVGTATSEVWADNGNATQPFAPIQGTFLDTGCGAPFSGVRDGDTVTWMSQDERGAGQIVRANGAAAVPVSTYSAAAMIQGVMTTGDFAKAEAFVHQLDGHVFYWIHLEGLDTTPVLDLTENIWAERAHWMPNLASWIPHTARCHCFAFGRHLVGARANGVIYELSDLFRSDYIV